MTIKTVYFIQTVLLLLVPVSGAGLVFDQNGSQWRGTQALRSGNYKKALAEMKADKAAADTAFHHFKKGCAYEGLKNWSKALHHFRINAIAGNEYSPFAYEKIGDIELKQQRYESALKAYRVAAQTTSMQSYRDMLHKKMYSVALEHADTLGEIAWLQEIVGEDKTIPDTGVKNLFVQLIESGNSGDLDSMLQKYLDSAAYTDALCYIGGLLSADSLMDTLFSTKTLYLFSELFFTCRKYGRSKEWLQKAQGRKDFAGAVSRKRYLYHHAMLNYKLENYSEAILWGKQYDKAFGAEPGLIFAIARSYRNQGKNEEASFWYDRHVQLYPLHGRTQDILWYRAWQKEEAGKFEEARRLYKEIFRSRKKSSNADGACFRYALSFYRESKFTEALDAFDVFLDRYPDSPLAVGGRYWKAKCFFSLNKNDKAKEACGAIINTNPSDYYAFRARELTLLIGDSLPGLQVDTAVSEERVRWWLDSVSQKDSADTVTAADSARFYMGSSLAAAGMARHARIMLQQIESSYGKNLLMQYTLANLYRVFGDPTASFRVARRLSWRIPEEARSCMPAQVYALLFPRYFTESIRREAEKNGIEPELVISVIRQESVFDPVIVSPAGAIGLMQIMPYTGEEIARDLKQTFVLDSLYDPAVNIRFGAYYLKKLLNQFKGNSILAVAGYNGGPHNAKKWNAQNSDDGFDMFVEDIGFSETRTYVKKVMGNYWTYMELKKCGVYDGWQ